MMCVLHQVLLVSRVEAPVGRGLLLHGKGAEGRGHLRVTIGHLRVTIGNIRVTIGHLRVTIAYFMIT